MNIFEVASRLKLRFPSPKGLLTAEDLWDLPLTSNTGKANLDDVARTIHGEIESQPKVSFVHKAAASADSEKQAALAIVVHIIEIRLAEAEQRHQAQERREKKQQLLNLIAQKETEQLAGTSLDDLRAMVAQMGD